MSEDTPEDSKFISEVELTKDGGVVKKVLSPGEGDMPVTGDQVEVHYRGTLEDGTQFDSSYDRNDPLKFNIGQGMVIKGWDLGIMSMQVGEKAQLVIKSEYGYGQSGSPPTIPGGATLIFDVELVSINPKTEEGEDDKDEEEVPDETRIENAKKLKEEGKEKFVAGELFDALAKYREATMELDEVLEDTEESDGLKKTLNLNIAVVTKKMEKWPETINACNEALKYEENNVKALFFRSIASRNLKDFDQALEDIKTVIKLNPKDKALRKEFEVTKEQKKKYLSQQKGVFEKAFSSGLYSEKSDIVKTRVESELPKYDPSNPKVFMDIQVGDTEPKKIIFELFKNYTPKTVENFRCLCTGEKTSEDPALHYKGNKFHRIIKSFMAQGGDTTKGDGTGGLSIYGGKFDDEQVWLPHAEKGLLSMVNAGPNTNGSQFFITFVETPHLNEKHTVFGRVIKGMDVVKEMEAVKTGASDKPVDPVQVIDCGEYTEEIDEAELELDKE